MPAFNARQQSSLSRLAPTIDKSHKSTIIKTVTTVTGIPFCWKQKSLLVLIIFFYLVDPTTMDQELHYVQLRLCTLCQSRWITDNDNHRISPQKHLADISVLVDGLPSGFPFTALGVFRPHFFDVFQKPVQNRQKSQEY